MEILAIILGLLIAGTIIILPVVLLCAVLRIFIELTIKFEELVGFFIFQPTKYYSKCFYIFV